MMLKMMWFASLLIFVSIGGCFCDDDKEERECFKKNREKCGEHEIMNMNFPQTDEELMAGCRKFISRGNCLIEVIESCYNDPDSFVNRVQNSVDYLKATCQEDNPTFKAITNNLPCVERVLKSRPAGYCYLGMSERNREVIRTHMEPLIEIDELKEDVAHCLLDTMEVTCQGITYGYHCGEEVKDAVEEIEAHIHSQHSLQCTPEQLEELSPFMRMFEDLLKEELALQNVLGRKRK